MKCKKCGVELAEGALFCWACGAKAETPKKRCSACGQVLSEGAKFCTNCGIRIFPEPQPVVMSADSKVQEETSAESNVPKDIPEEVSNEYHESGEPKHSAEGEDTGDITEYVRSGDLPPADDIGQSPTRIGQKSTGGVFDKIPKPQFSKAWEMAGETLNQKAKEAKVNAPFGKNKGIKTYPIIGAVAVLLVVCLGMVIIPGRSTDTAKTPLPETEEETVVSLVRLPISSSECAGRDFKEIRAQLEEAGFTNISATAVEDLQVRDKELLDTVEVITVNESEDFSAETELDPATAISITYHAYAPCRVDLEVKCDPNLIFSRYDVKILLDDKKQGIIPHGESKTMKFLLYPGDHMITFVSDDSSDVKGQFSLTVSGEMNIGVRITCHSDEIEVEQLFVEDEGLLEEGEIMITSSLLDSAGQNVKKVEKSFNDAGFTNVTVQPLYDVPADSTDIGVVTEVLIGGKTKYDRGAVVQNDVEVIIKYHEDEAQDPVKIEAAKALEALEKNLPKEMAERAVVVAMTNGQATDVFKKDGYTYDSKKFHKYKDTGDFFMTVYQTGTWSALDEKTWHVEGIVLRIYGYGTYLVANCDVSKSKESYVVKNVDRSIVDKSMADEAYLNPDTKEHWEPDDSNPFLTVPESLIKEDRDDSAAEEKVAEQDNRQVWIDEQFSLWNGSHKDLEKLIKKNLNDEKSYKHIETTYIDVADETMRDRANELLKSAGYSERVEIGDLFITTEFSAKNAFNATIKATAYGIASYSDNTIRLIAIE